MSNNESKEFQYTYSAKERSELKKIRDKYILSTPSHALDKMEEIRRLDASVSRLSTTVSLIVGIIGTLVMGTGMSIIMTDIKYVLSLSSTDAMIVGVTLGIIGMAAVIAAYPLYQLISKRKRKKLAPKILRLTEELLKDKQ